MRVDPRGDEELLAAGLSSIGVLAADVYDEIAAPGWRTASRLPGARSAIVLGAGGRTFGAALARSPEAAAGLDPVDRYTRRVVGSYLERVAEAGASARAGFYWEQCDGAFLDFVALGVRAGLGVPGRLGVLLHPEFGPWLALRAVVLCSAELAPTPPLGDFAPCRGCAAPCAVACPARALGAGDAPGELDAQRCASARLAADGCTRACAARRACVIGGAHAYADRDEAHYMATVARTLRLLDSASPGQRAGFPTRG